MLKRSGNSTIIFTQVTDSLFFTSVSDVCAIRIATERLNSGPTTLKIGRAAFAPASLQAPISKAATVPMAAATSHGRGSDRNFQIPKGQSQAKKYQKPGVISIFSSARAKLSLTYK